MRPPYTARDQIEDAIIGWLEKNRGVRDIATMHGMPSRMTIYRWGVERPVFGQRMAQARAYGRFQAHAAIHGNGLFNPAQAEAFLVQVRRGRRIENLVKQPEWPSPYRLRRWKARQPQFRAALREAVRFARKCGPCRGPMTRLSLVGSCCGSTGARPWPRS